MRLPIVLLIAIAASAAGFAAASLLEGPKAIAPRGFDATVANAVVPRDSAEEDSEELLASPEMRPRTSLGVSADQPGASTDAPAQEGAASPLFSDALLAHHAVEFNAGWKSERAEMAPPSETQEGELAFRKATLLLSREIGTRAAKALNSEEAAAKALEDGSAAGLLAGMKVGAWTPPDGFVLEQDFSKVTAARRGGGTIDGGTLTRDNEAVIVDGSVISFGPGVFTLDERRFRGADRSNVPMDVTVIGAGKDSTLLRMGDIGSRADIQRLTFRNLTIDADNDGLFDQRGGSLSLHLESVRVVRFDAGHGGCTIFSVRGGTAVTAVDSEFAGGYGRSPGSGDFSRGEPFLGHFKNCTFDLVNFRNLPSLTTGQAHFEGCRLRLKVPDPRSWDNPRVMFTSCSYEAIPGDAKDLQKDLADLFPQLR